MFINAVLTRVHCLVTWKGKSGLDEEGKGTEQEGQLKPQRKGTLGEQVNDSARQETSKMTQ